MRLYEQFKRKGVSSEFVKLPGIGHSGIGKGHEATSNASPTKLEKTLAFIDATIDAEVC